jgi:hypothetical protein
MEQPLRIENGMAMIDGALGTGVAWNEAAVARFSA